SNSRMGAVYELIGAEEGESLWAMNCKRLLAHVTSSVEVPAHTQREANLDVPACNEVVARIKVPADVNGLISSDVPSCFEVVEYVVVAPRINVASGLDGSMRLKALASLDCPPCLEPRSSRHQDDIRCGYIPTERNGPEVLLQVKMSWKGSWEFFCPDI